MIGQDHRGFYIPRDYTMELAHRRRTGLGSHGESPGEIVDRLSRVGFHARDVLPARPGDGRRVRPDAGPAARPLDSTGKPHSSAKTSPTATASCGTTRSTSCPREPAPAAPPHQLSARSSGSDAMNRARPTVAELRARVQKDRHREIGNWLARRVRPSDGRLRLLAGDPARA